MNRAAVAILSVWLAACVPSTEVDTDPPSGPTAAVVEVIDGDSLVVRVDGTDTEVRLDQINAPERDECHGTSAADALEALVGSEVTLEVTGTDQFGRSLGRVWAGGEPVNERLVADGHALATGGSSLVDLESDARDADLGLWSPTACGGAVDLELTVEFTQPDPPGPDEPDAEHVTIHNAGPGPADISGFVLRDESSVNRLRFPPGTVIPAASSLRVSTGCRPLDGIAWCAGGPVWNNGGDSALLLAPNGNVVAHARYAPSDRSG